MLHQGEGEKVRGIIVLNFLKLARYMTIINSDCFLFHPLFLFIQQIEERGQVTCLFISLVATLKHTLLFFSNRMGNKRIVKLLLNLIQPKLNV